MTLRTMIEVCSAHTEPHSVLGRLKLYCEFQASPISDTHIHRQVSRMTPEMQVQSFAHSLLGFNQETKS